MNRSYIFLTLFFVSLLPFTGCKKMDSTYKGFIVPGGLVYPQKASSPMIYVGRNRVKISWLKGSDPTVTKAQIFWNNYTDSIELEIPSEGDTVSTIINNLPEKSYDFVIKTYDSKGNSSVPVEILTRAYGDEYQASLLSTPLNSAILNNKGEVTIEWGAADISDGAFATEVQYTDTSGETWIQLFPISDATSIVSNVKSDTTFKYRTLFIPDSLSIDTFYTSFQENKEYLFDKTEWKVIGFSTQHPGAANAVTNVIDGNPRTRWHTWVGHSQYPHFVTIDMGAEHTITTFELYRMTGDVRACNTFQLLVSVDNVTWMDMGIFNFNRLIDDGQLYAISSHPTARYFKFVGLSGPEDYMVTGEISVYGF